MADNKVPGMERWLKTNEMDSRLEHYAVTYKKWHDAIPTALHPIVDQMIAQFEYYGHKRINKTLVALNAKLNAEGEFDPLGAVYTYINDDRGRLNSSNDYWHEYKLINGIDNAYCTDNITRIPRASWECIDSIVIIDDCCGTGKSLSKFIESCREDFVGKGYSDKVFSGKVLYYLVVHAMDEARTLLGQIAEKTGLKIHLISLNSSPKFFPQGKEDERWLFTEKVQELGITSNPLGFDESEALIAFENNTPNNTFPVFWEETSKISPVFPRRAKPNNPWKNMKKNKKRRRNQNYEAKIKEISNG